MAMTETPASPGASWATNAAKWKTAASTRNAQPAAGDAVYALGMIGAIVYFLQVAQSKPEYGLAFLKAAVWPALLVYTAFKRLG